MCVCVCVFATMLVCMCALAWCVVHLFEIFVACFRYVDEMHATNWLFKLHWHYLLRLHRLTTGTAASLSACIGVALGKGLRRRGKGQYDTCACSGLSCLCVCLCNICFYLCLCNKIRWFFFLSLLVWAFVSEWLHQESGNTVIYMHYANESVLQTTTRVLYVLTDFHFTQPLI